VLVIFGGCAGLCYNALWYFPVLMVTGGLTTLLWDLYGRRTVATLRAKLAGHRQNSPRDTEEINVQSIPVSQLQPSSVAQRRAIVSQANPNPQGSLTIPHVEPGASHQERETMDTLSHAIPLKVGLTIIVGFFGTSFSFALLICTANASLASFIAILIARGIINNPPLELDLFASMYLAGTVIFGGGPVVIPLLREYVVQPGWVSSRDFLIGLAIIQAFPGPNFNFAVYLGALAVASISKPTIIGAFLAFLGLFLPGLLLTVGFQSIWRILRTKPVTTSILRGLNPTAVGLIFTAVYRLWEIGYLSSDTTNGQSLGNNPFWLVVATIAYSCTGWFQTPPAAAIVLGGVLGLCWYAAVGK
jgi:chromate transport protein ChrA